MIRGAFALVIVPLVAACVMIPTSGEAPTSAAPLALAAASSRIPRVPPWRTAWC
jgi:hypothetical protein